MNQSQAHPAGMGRAQTRISLPSRTRTPHRLYFLSGVQFPFSDNNDKEEGITDTLHGISTCILWRVRTARNTAPPSLPSRHSSTSWKTTALYSNLTLPLRFRSAGKWPQLLFEGLREKKSRSHLSTHWHHGYKNRRNSTKPEHHNAFRGCFKVPLFECRAFWPKKGDALGARLITDPAPTSSPLLVSVAPSWCLRDGLHNERAYLPDVFSTCF